MGILNYLLYTILQCLDFLILIRCVMSFLVRGDSKLFSFVYTVTEPVLSPIRSLLDKTPLGGMMIDFSPFIAILLINLLTSILLG